MVCLESNYYILTSKEEKLRYWKNGIHDEEVEGATPIPKKDWDFLVQQSKIEGFEIVDNHGHPMPKIKYDPIKELALTTRIKRDNLLEEVLWRRDRHNDEVLLGLEPTEPLLPILEYIQALRDVPQQEGFPVNVVWPVPPWESIESVDTTEIEGEA